MKTIRRKLSARYLTALRSHLREVVPGRSERAQSLGRAISAGGLATLDLAVMHERALIALASSHDFTHVRNGFLKRAGVFLTQAFVPLEDARDAERRSARVLQDRNDSLREGNRLLELEIVRRKAAEAIVSKGKEQYRKLFRESEVMHRKLRQLTRQIITAQEEERKEISRELHDEVVQTLVGINVELAALSGSARSGLQTLQHKILRTQRLVERSVTAVHRFARDLRPAVLDDLGLIPALHAYNIGLAKRKRLKIRLTAFGGVEALGGTERTVLYRVAQEALTNVTRHAQATEVKMSIRKRNDTIRMEIQDNGKSFQVAHVMAAKNRTRLGLIGMKERLEMVGGALSIESSPGKGTTVRADIPFDKKSPKP